MKRHYGHDLSLRFDGGLYIGAGKDLESGSLFSGLIDDVRIYNVILTAEGITAWAQ